MPKNPQQVEEDRPADLEENSKKPEQKAHYRTRTSFWDVFVRQGMGDLAVKIGTGAALLLLVLVIIWVMGRYYLHGNRITFAAAAAETETTPQATVQAPEYVVSSSVNGVEREADLHTILPSRPRFDVIAYMVEKGDTVFGIAEKYNLRPETILWGNINTLYDNPEMLYEGQVLNIMPTDGTYHYWSAGEDLNLVANYYGVTADTIINWPGNHMDAATLGDLSAPNITVGTWLIVPGGSRPFNNWAGIRVTRDDPTQARQYGEGYCGTITEGYVGTGTFIWPTVWHYISGYDYSPSTNHFAVDIGGAVGQDLYATDNGVVVYSGWNNAGYGYLVVIDHEHWQSLYAHMDAIYVGCGQNVEQGEVIGTMGLSGRTTGPHLHFELYSDQYGMVNPLMFLPAQ